MSPLPKKPKTNKFDFKVRLGHICSVVFTTNVIRCSVLMATPLIDRHTVAVHTSWLGERRTLVNTPMVSPKRNGCGDLA